MFDTILVANRGEIACRIIKTARAMGMRSVAIYSAADKDSLPVHLADSAYYVGESAAKDSYLNIDNILRAASQSGAQAIHPGYGFLSENADFAAACAAQGIVFVGPSIQAMELMASKQRAKQLLEKTGVPLTPGYHGADQSEKTLTEEARKIGFPLLIKAANGGGGKGMRAVFNASEFSDALAAAKRESLAYFADEQVILEKLIVNPRHVEVQVMADNHGAVVHLFERDCSIQRRHQKIIEEAPAPGLSKTLRQQLVTAACDVARAINYRGAGTVEFLLTEDRQFYFMEMNTRLQVEHPVTEMITGLDLVAWQFKIAANETLPCQQVEIHAKGHAIEARIYAEDPHQGFVPSIGRIHFLREPVGEGIRLDTSVRTGSEISRYYDPMVAKLIAWGQDREQALQRLQIALSHYYVGGIKTNISFLQAICAQDRFKQAKLGTAFLEQETIHLISLDKTLALMMAVAFDYLQTVQRIQDPLLQAAFAWQIQGKTQWTWRYQEEEIIEILVTPRDDKQFILQIKDESFEIGAELAGDKLTLETRQQQYTAYVDQQEQKICLYSEHGQGIIERFQWQKQDAHTQQGQLTAPMPATVVAILKQIGEQVKAGDRLLVLEAMKMEHTIHAPNDGTVLDIFYQVGSQVGEGVQLLSLGESG